MKKLLKGGLIPFLLLWTGVLVAQNRTITGKVLDDSNSPIAGASVIVKSTTVGTTTNDKGEFTLSVAPSAKTLVISSIGFADREVNITGNSVTVSLAKSAAAALDEVIVVGYGTQKKVNVSGAIASVKAKDLENVPNGRIEQALQGRVSGVTILQNSGQPGSSSTIRVRGITTFNNNNPLWVVDGVVVDAGGIGYLNQSDIESIEVLKDAASAAIYGTRAATGVILVTTKKGKAGKLTVSYNGFYGTSAPARILQLANAAQYATLINERSVAGGGAVVYADPSSLGVGTDWQKAIFNNNASRFLHEVSMSGGNDKSTFFLSAGLQKQNGIVTTDISKYEKKNFRLASTHKIGSMVTVGQTIGYTYQRSTGLGNTNSEFGGPLSSAVNLDPITPIVVTDPIAAAAPIYANNPAAVRDANGNPYGISSVVGQEMTNPIAYTTTRLGGYNWSDDFVGNAYLEIAPIKGLKLRTSVGVKKAYYGNVGFTPVFFLSPTVVAAQNSYTKGENRTFSWNVENTVTYNRKFGDHDVTVLVGQGAYVENIGGNVGMTYLGLPITKYQDASFGFDLPLAQKIGYAGDMVQHKISSLFARLNYSYQDKYVLTGIVRRDGSTRFGPNHKYATFPSFTAGWNADKEKFWPSNKVVTALKIRGGYGSTGNDASADFRYLSTVVGGYNYAIGNTGAVTTGYAPLTLDNPDLRWEKTTSADVGFDAVLFRTLNLTVNWYDKKTSGILRPVVIPGYVGVAANPYDNVADMKNSGIEIELGYKKRLGELNISVNANFSYLKNTVTYVAKDTNFIGGDASFQSMGAITRTKVGESYNSFWGYQRLGIFQTQAEVDNYKNKAGTAIQPNARPGDFMWADLNGDGVISSDDKDKTFLGSNVPKYTFGFTINLEYKGFDMTIFAQGAAGNKIFQGLRRLDIQNANFSTRALGRWTGPGTSNDYPRLISSDPNNNIAWMSDFYLEKGDYLRLKVMQLGYTMPNRLFGKTGISKVRFYVTAENLFTLTKYTGYDPEVGGGVFGIDKGQYPQARAFIGGLQLQF